MAKASVTASHPQQHQRKTDKTLAARRKAIGLELVKVFAPTPEERAAADKRKAEADAAKLQQQARERERYKIRLAKLQDQAEASNPFCGSSPDETMERCSQTLKYLNSIEPIDGVFPGEDATMGLFWIYGALTDALDKQSNVQSRARKAVRHG